MDALLKRISGCDNKLATLNKRILRLQATIDTKSSFVKSSSDTSMSDEVKWALIELSRAQDEIQRAYKELATVNEKRSTYAHRLNEITERNSKIIHVPAIEEFLDTWKLNAYDFFVKEVDAVKPFVDSISSYTWSDKQSKLKERFHGFTLELASIRNSSDRLSRLNSFLDREVDSKRLDFFSRCDGIVGNIIDASNLRVGDNGSINGVIIGDLGRAQIDTIFAGGYNVQRLHYRVLVNLIENGNIINDEYTDSSLDR